jgi:hypothetical protein
VDRFRTGNPRSSISMFVESYHPVCPVNSISEQFSLVNPKISQVFAGKSMKSHSDTTGYPLVIQQFSTEDHHVNREFSEKNGPWLSVRLSQATRYFCLSYGYHVVIKLCNCTFIQTNGRFSSLPCLITGGLFTTGYHRVPSSSRTWCDWKLPIFSLMISAYF